MLMLGVVAMGVNGVKVSLRDVPRAPVAGIHRCGNRVSSGDNELTDWLAGYWASLGVFTARVVRGDELSSPYFWVKQVNMMQMDWYKKGIQSKG